MSVGSDGLVREAVEQQIHDRAFGGCDPVDLLFELGRFGRSGEDEHCIARMLALALVETDPGGRRERATFARRWIVSLPTPSSRHGASLPQSKSNLQSTE